MPFFPQVFGQSIGAGLGAGEDEHLIPAFAMKKVREQIALATLIDRMRGLDHTFRQRYCDERLRSVSGRLSRAIGQAADLVRIGRRKEQVLAPFGQQLDDASHVMDESHIEHAIGFIEHQDLDPR